MPGENFEMFKMPKPSSKELLATQKQKYIACLNQVKADLNEVNQLLQTNPNNSMLLELQQLILQSLQKANPEKKLDQLTAISKDLKK